MMIHINMIYITAYVSKHVFTVEVKRRIIQKLGISLNRILQKTFGWKKARPKWNEILENRPFD